MSIYLIDFLIFILFVVVVVFAFIYLKKDSCFCTAFFWTFFGGSLVLCFLAVLFVWLAVDFLVDMLKDDDDDCITVENNAFLTLLALSMLFIVLLFLREFLAMSSDDDLESLEMISLLEL